MYQDCIEPAGDRRAQQEKADNIGAPFTGKQPGQHKDIFPVLPYSQKESGDIDPEKHSGHIM